MPEKVADAGVAYQIDIDQMEQAKLIIVEFHITTADGYGLYDVKVDSGLRYAQRN